METRQGKIESKTLAKAKNQAPYCTFVIDGKKYNTFDAKIIDFFDIDDHVIMEGNQEGQFWNMKTMVINPNPIENGLVDAPVEKPAEAKAWNETTAKNGNFHLSPEEVKCRALECAIALKMPDGKVIEQADIFTRWIYGQ